MSNVSLSWSLTCLSLGLWRSWPLTGGTASDVLSDPSQTSQELCACIHGRPPQECGMILSFKSSPTISFFHQTPENLLCIPSAHWEKPWTYFNSFWGPWFWAWEKLAPSLTFSPFKSSSFPFSIGRALTHGSGSYVKLVELLELVTGLILTKVEISLFGCWPWPRGQVFLRNKKGNWLMCWVMFAVRCREQSTFALKGKSYHLRVQLRGGPLATVSDISIFLLWTVGKARLSSSICEDLLG